METQQSLELEILDSQYLINLFDNVFIFYQLHKLVFQIFLIIFFSFLGYLQGLKKQSEVIISKKNKLQIENSEKIKQKYEINRNLYFKLSQKLKSIIRYTLLINLISFLYGFLYFQLTLVFFLGVATLKYYLAYKVKYLESEIKNINKYNSEFGQTILQQLDIKMIEELKEIIYRNKQDNRKCTQNCLHKQNILKMELDNYKNFRNELSNFKWCPQCANGQSAKCQSFCFDKFFNFSRQIGHIFNQKRQEILIHDRKNTQQKK